MSNRPAFTSNYLVCAGREIHYTEWGSQHRQTVIAWHGLARTGRDMDELAGFLCDQGYRVICPDTIGRGLSQWSPNPDVEYCLRFYAQIAADLLAQLKIDQAHWVGTSMGGALGMVCASGLFQPALKSKILSLTLNDTAPQVADAAIARIRAYAGSPPAFGTVQELEAFYRQVYKPFGDLTDAQWRRLTETSTRRLPNGQVTPHYDPAMVRQFVCHPDDYLIWDHYDALDIPVLSLRGESSDLVLAQTTAEMLRRGPGLLGLTELVEIAGCGHAPALNVLNQLQRIAGFISSAA